MSSPLTWELNGSVQTSNAGPKLLIPVLSSRQTNYRTVQVLDRKKKIARLEEYYGPIDHGDANSDLKTEVGNFGIFALDLGDQKIVESWPCFAVKVAAIADDKRLESNPPLHLTIVELVGREDLISRTVRNAYRSLSATNPRAGDFWRDNIVLPRFIKTAIETVLDADLTHGAFSCQLVRNTVNFVIPDGVGSQIYKDDTISSIQGMFSAYARGFGLSEDLIIRESSGEFPIKEKDAPPLTMKDIVICGSKSLGSVVAKASTRQTLSRNVDCISYHQLVSATEIISSGKSINGEKFVVFAFGVMDKDLPQQIKNIKNRVPEDYSFHALYIGREPHWIVIERAKKAGLASVTLSYVGHAGWFTGESSIQPENHLIFLAGYMEEFLNSRSAVSWKEHAGALSLLGGAVCPRSRGGATTEGIRRCVVNLAMNSLSFKGAAGFDVAGHGVGNPPPPLLEPPYATGLLGELFGGVEPFKFSWQSRPRLADTRQRDVMSLLCRNVELPKLKSVSPGIEVLSAAFRALGWIVEPPLHADYFLASSNAVRAKVSIWTPKESTTPSSSPAWNRSDSDNNATDYPRLRIIYNNKVGQAERIRLCLKREYLIDQHQLPLIEGINYEKEIQAVVLLTLPASEIPSSIVPDDIKSKLQEKIYRNSCAKTGIELKNLDISYKNGSIIRNEAYRGITVRMPFTASATHMSSKVRITGRVSFDWNPEGGRIGDVSINKVTHP